MVLGLFFVFLFFGCTLERDNPYDPNGTNYNPSLYPSSSSLAPNSSSSFSSSSLPDSLVPCKHDAGCAEISAETCFAFGGQMVASCPASSSSLSATVSSSGGVSDGSSSSSGEGGSSSSLPPVMVLCALSDGTCPLTLIPQEACVTFGGTPVPSCAGSSSSALPSSSSIAPSSSSSAPLSSSSIVPSSSSSVPAFVCTMAATTGMVGVAITPVPVATCNGNTVTAGLAWTPANLTPATAGSVSVSVFVNAGYGVCSSMVAQCGSVTVPVYSGKGNNISSYKTVRIGDQTWMAENLNYVVEGSKCYSNSSANCDEYGSLYNWATAMNLPSSCNSNICSSQIQSPHRGICPSGYHIPSQAEWNTLSSYVQSTSDCRGCNAKLLKATSGWNNKYFGGGSGNGTDEYGFSALPGGRDYSDGSFIFVGDYGYWWSASEYDRSFAYYQNMKNTDDFADLDLDLIKSGLQSVRCVQD